MCSHDARAYGHVHPCAHASVAFCNIFSIFCNNDHALTGLYIEHASDIIGIYINGRYITTLFPIGDAIDAASLNQRYSFESFQPYLVIGRNVLE